MTVAEILAEVRRCNVELLVIDGKLKAVPAGVLPPSLKAALRAQAPEIRARLLAPLPPDGHPAYSILSLCREHGVALRFNPVTGDLVVGKAGAKADEPSQPWPALLAAIEAHLQSVARLVEVGWHLRADFPRAAAA